MESNEKYPRFVAFGHGFVLATDSQEEANDCIKINGNGSIYIAEHLIAPTGDAISRSEAVRVADSVANESTRISEECWNEGDHDTAKIRMGWSNGAQTVSKALAALPSIQPAPTTAAELDLEAIEQRERAATKGPWVYMTDETFWGQIRAGGFSDGDNQSFAHIADTPEGDDRNDDMEFIAWGRTDIPNLIAEVKRLRSDCFDLVDEREALRVAPTAALKWIIKRDANLDLHETFCATSYDDDAKCDCRIAKVRAELESTVIVPTTAAIHAAAEIVRKVGTLNRGFAFWSTRATVYGQDIEALEHGFKVAVDEISAHLAADSATDRAEEMRADENWALRELADGWIGSDEREGEYGFYRNARHVLRLIAESSSNAMREACVAKVEQMRVDVQEEADAEREMGWLGAAAQLAIIDEIIIALKAIELKGAGDAK